MITTGGHHLLSESSEGIGTQQEKDSTFCSCMRRTKRGTDSGLGASCPCTLGRGAPRFSGGGAGVQEEGFLLEGGLFSGQPDLSPVCSGSGGGAAVLGRGARYGARKNLRVPGGYQLLHTQSAGKVRVISRREKVN